MYLSDTTVNLVLSKAVFQLLCLEMHTQMLCDDFMVGKLDLL